MGNFGKFRQVLAKPRPPKSSGAVALFCAVATRRRHEGTKGRSKARSKTRCLVFRFVSPSSLRPFVSLLLCECPDHVRLLLPTEALRRRARRRATISRNHGRRRR